MQVRIETLDALNSLFAWDVQNRLGIEALDGLITKENAA